MELQPDEEDLVEDDGDAEEQSEEAGRARLQDSGDGKSVADLLPVETIDRKESVEIWKSRNETDVIGMRTVTVIYTSMGFIYTTFQFLIMMCSGLMKTRRTVWIV